jgi:epoxyqueuosine reductase
VRGHENDRERGKRCLICYRYRLGQAFRQAQKLNCEFLTTTLTTSPHKDARAISRIGEELAAGFKIKFLNQDFKKQDGFKKSSAMSRQLGLYRQNYCGCEYSQRINESAANLPIKS